MKIDRDGRVVVDGRTVGWVDRFDPTKRGKKSYKWRGVREGGHSTTARFATRAEAAAWVVSAD